MAARYGICALAALLAGCNHYPESYPPPEQRTPITAEEAGESLRFVSMNEVGAEDYFVRDIGGLEAGQWRWTGEQPTLRFLLDKVENLKFTFQFSVAGATFETTGPVTVTFLVNDKELDRVRYDAPGEKSFEKPVPADWLEAGADTLVTAKVDPVWVSPQDRTKLGVILLRAGFDER